MRIESHTVLLCRLCPASEFYQLWFKINFPKRSPIQKWRIHFRWQSLSLTVTKMIQNASLWMNLCESVKCVNPMWPGYQRKQPLSYLVKLVTWLTHEVKILHNEIWRKGNCPEKELNTCFSPLYSPRGKCIYKKFKVLIFLDLLKSESLETESLQEWLTRLPAHPKPCVQVSATRSLPSLRVSHHWCGSNPLHSEIPRGRNSLIHICIPCPHTF